ncbi:MAG: response regulator transcription factor [Rhodospirillales bacterium]|nr:response regulator transcription factor [Rhodospirillales bacterium]MDH3917212.1 response regulator transcription factor [Rhodospirillales bacterium]MDH3967627.1 response regulator transcription factor [Rhodospirillales bacterium]
MQDPRSANPILVVEDDRNIAALVETYLARAGFEPIVAHDGPAGLELLRRHKPGFVVLDLMLPGVDGWDLCREIRKQSDVPILILTAREEELDRILGFSLGADDYVVKPFSPRELVERVKAILRRSRPAAPDADARLQHGPLVLEPDKHKVTLDGRSIPLTPSEYTLLHTLMSAPGRVFSRDTLLGHLHRHGEAVVDRVIDVHIGKLRQKIEADPSEPRLILTVRGVGYRFAERDET